MSRGGGLGPALRCMLKDAFGTGVMDKLSAGDQSLFHRHLAPGAETIRNVTGG